MEPRWSSPAPAQPGADSAGRGSSNNREAGGVRPFGAFDPIHLVHVNLFFHCFRHPTLNLTFLQDPDRPPVPEPRDQSISALSNPAQQNPTGLSLYPRPATPKYTSFLSLPHPARTGPHYPASFPTRDSAHDNTLRRVTMPVSIEELDATVRAFYEGRGEQVCALSSGRPANRPAELAVKELGQTDC